MFVVRRSFRNYGQVLIPGSVVEPGNIKNFKSRLRDRVILEVPEQDFDKWNKYFIAKYGVAIKRKAKEVKPVKGQVKEADVKPIVKPVAKPTTV